MLQGIFLEQIVSRASPGWTQEDSIKVLLSVLGESEHRDLLLVGQLQEIGVYNLEVFGLLQIVDLRVVDRILNFQWIHV